MNIPAPDKNHLAKAAADLGLNLNEAELEVYSALLEKTHAGYASLDSLYSAHDHSKTAKRILGHTPAESDNKLNAWYWMTHMPGNPSATLLRHKRVAIKDNVCMKDVPMMNGSGLMEGYVPDCDATVVGRILEAGGTIVGKSTCENMCMSGVSYQTKYGPVRNPYNLGYSTGGSSSGSVALVASGAVDMAIGGDQGGSIRNPASNTGVVGMKPTYGLVPYTGEDCIELRMGIPAIYDSGIVPEETSLDHVGPIARTVFDCALLLEAIAGYDGGRDQRQPSNLAKVNYSVEVLKPTCDLKIGVLSEGFELCEAEVQRVVRGAVESIRNRHTFKAINEVSIPNHGISSNMLTPIITQGPSSVLFEGEGLGSGSKGYTPLCLAQVLRDGYRHKLNELDHSGKIQTIYGTYARQKFGNRCYIKAHNFGVQLGQDYDRALMECDVLLMPTSPRTACPIVDVKKDGLEEYITNSLGYRLNTYGSNVTGHPGLSLNAGYSETGLPIGLLLIGRRFDDATVLRAANEIEATLKDVQRKPDFWVGGTE